MALVFDFDSTLIRDESLVQLLKDSLTAQQQQQQLLNTHATTTDDGSSSLSSLVNNDSETSDQNHLVREIEQITNLGITNQISMLESYNRRLAIAKPTIQNMRDYVQRCEEIATPGMKNLINQIRRLFPQVPIRVVSQGPRCIVEPIVQQLFQIPGHHVHCVELDTERMQVSESDEMLIHGKSKMVQRSLATAESPFPVIMVGDGVSDMKVKLEGVAHYAIGYGEWLQFEQTKQLADYYVMNTHELELVLLKLLSEVHFGLKERSKTNNLFAGPAVLPTEVVHKMNQDLLSYGQSGISVMEFSHRTREFEDILNNTEQLVRELLNVPSDYEVLFVQGGATMQFSSIPMNLAHSNASYIVTGEWSKKAIAEAKKLSSIHRSIIHSAADCSSTQFTTIPEQFSFNQVSDYTYYCDNETVHGVEFPGIPEIVNVSECGNLVCDMSSNLFTRSVDVKKYGLIYSCAQKNFGIAGLTIVIVRGDLLGKASHAIPSYLDYKYLKDGGSMTNTPPTFAIYATQLVLKWIKENGGVEEMNRRCIDRSQKLYDVIEKSSIYTCPVMPHCRSRINVVFRVKADKDLEKQFVDEAASLGLVGLAGHRSVGGIRASIYNATSVNTVDKLIKFMKDFEQKHSS